MKEPDAARRIMTCVYKGSRRDDTYLFVPTRERLERVPQPLLEMLGRLKLVIEFELHHGRRLAREDVGAVMRNLEDKGYHLQMPPSDSWHGRGVH